MIEGIIDFGNECTETTGIDWVAGIQKEVADLLAWKKGIWDIAKKINYP